MICGGRIYKGQDNYIELYVPDASGITGIEIYTGGELKITPEEYEIVDDNTIGINLTAEDLDPLEDGVIYYTVEYEDGGMGTNSNYYLKTPAGYTANTLDELIEEAYDEGYADGQEDCTGGTCEGVYESGYTDGYESGYTEGYESGKLATKVRIVYNVTSTTEPTLILNPSGMTYINRSFTKAEFEDGEEITLASSYTFSNTGRQTLYFSLVNSTILGYGPYGTFCGCTQIIEATIPDSVVEIHTSCFGSCTSLSSVTMSDNVRVIGDYCFWNCKSLTETGFTFPLGMTKINYGSFKMTGIEHLVVPGRITEIGDDAFYICRDLKSVVLENGVSVIGGLNGVFASCTALTSATISSTVTSIGERCFHECRSMQEIVFEGDVPPTLAVTSGQFASLGSTSYTFPIWVPCDSYDAYVQAFGPEYAPRVMCREG